MGDFRRMTRARITEYAEIHGLPPPVLKWSTNQDVRHWGYPGKTYETREEWFYDWFRAMFIMPHWDLDRQLNYYRELWAKAYDPIMKQAIEDLGKEVAQMVQEANRD